MGDKVGAASEVTPEVERVSGAMVGWNYKLYEFRGDGRDLYLQENRDRNIFHFRSETCFGAEILHFMCVQSL